MECRRRGPSPVADETYEVRYGGKKLFVIGFTPIVLLGTEVYVTMRPCRALRRLGPKGFLALRERLNGLNAYRLYCQIDPADRAAQRWAEFFGFVRLPAMTAGRLQYLRESK